MLSSSQILTLFKIHNHGDNILTSLPKDVLYKICSMKEIDRLFETISKEFIEVCQQYSERTGTLSDFNGEKCNAQMAIGLTYRIQNELKDKTKSLILLIASINEFSSQIPFRNPNFYMLFNKFREKHCLRYTPNARDIKTIKLQDYLYHSVLTAHLYNCNYFMNPDKSQRINMQKLNALLKNNIIKKLEDTADRMLNCYEEGREIKFEIEYGPSFSFSLKALVENYITEHKLKQILLRKQEMTNQEKDVCFLIKAQQPVRAITEDDVAKYPLQLVGNSTTTEELAEGIKDQLSTLVQDFPELSEEEYLTEEVEVISKKSKRPKHHADRNDGTDQNVFEEMPLISLSLDNGQKQSLDLEPLIQGHYSFFSCTAREEEQDDKPEQKRKHECTIL